MEGEREIPMIKVVTVFGTRPEAIKMCPLVKELEANDKINSVVCVTGQHQEMLKSVLEVFEVVPDYDLKIMKSGQTLFDITTEILTKIRPVLEKENPDLVLVHGDTSTTFAVALASYYLNIRIGHVEAGLRTHNIYSPYPEEFNRQAVSIVADLNFAPTNAAATTLLKEGKKPETVFVTGNTAIDALKTTITVETESKYKDWIGDSKLITITAHRRENLGEPMENMFKAISRVMSENENVKAIYPIHMNPQVRKIADKYLSSNSRIKIVEPMDVLEFHNLMNQSHIIITDSGGIQEEAPSLGKPVLVMRDTTERPEGIEAGTLLLVGTEEESIYQSFTSLLNDAEMYDKMSRANNPYGDGSASQQIVEHIINSFR